MLPRITDVKHIGDYKLLLSFTTGERGMIDLSTRIIGRSGVFVPLQDIHYFAKVAVDPEAGTIVWPNGVDLDPDVLYERTMKEKQDWRLRLVDENRQEAISVAS